MSKIEELSAAEAARIEMKELRLKQVILAKAPLLIGLLPDVIGDDNNKLPKNLQGVVNTVTLEEVITSPSVPDGRSVEVELLWNGNLIDSVEKTTPVVVPFDMTLPATATVAPGVFQLSYVTRYNGNPSDESPQAAIYIDQEAPNKGNPGEPVTLPLEIVDNVITREYLVANNGVLITLPNHDDRRTGDIAEVYFGVSDPAVKIGEYITPEDPTTSITVTLTLAQAEAGKEGDRIIYYRLRDRVGNQGPHSDELDVYIALIPQPSALLPPDVPEAESPGFLIDLKDAYPSVGVVVKQYTNLLRDDNVVVTFDGLLQPPKPFGAGTEVIIDVPFADVAKNGDGPRAARVTYEIVRGDRRFPETVGKAININLTIPGPTNPEPDPETGNPNLEKVVVLGGTSTDPNKLTEEDANQPATASATIFTDSKLGDIVQLYWNRVAVPGPEGVYTVTGNEVPTDKMTFTIPWAIIEPTANNNVLPVHYVITNPANGSNGNPSPRQLVDVHVLAVTLPVPTIKFLYTKPSGEEVLNCASLRTIPNVGAAASVEVKGGAPLVSGLVLDFVWKGEGWDGTAPVPVPDFKFSKTLSGNEHVDGFTVYLPFETALKPIKDGSGEIVYTAHLDGRDESSDSHAVTVTVVDGDGAFCPI